MVHDVAAEKQTRKSAAVAHIEAENNRINPFDRQVAGRSFAKSGANVAPDIPDSTAFHQACTRQRSFDGCNKDLRGLEPRRS